MAGFILGRHPPADPAGRTSVPSVYVAGNVADLRATVIVAAATGLTVGAAINSDLTAEETAHAVERDRVIGEDAWNTRYADKDAIWSGNPNVVLVTEVADLPPGRALDVGAGEGADVLWLAARGWAVTGADISSVALARAAQEAQRQRLEVDWRQVDLLNDPPAPASYDLVTAHFMHLPGPDRRALYAALADAVVPGGTLLLVGHHPSHLPGGGHRPALLVTLFTPDLVPELAPDDWAIDVAEVRQRVARDPGNPSGPQIMLSDTVLRARRR
jgi:SAM-dependent methyltransferase